MSTLINRIGGVGRRGPEYDTIDNAALFDGGRLSRTFAAGNRKKFTIAFWSKRWKIDAAYAEIIARGSGLVGGGVSITYSFGIDQMGFYQSSGFGWVEPSRLYRDPTAFVHVAIVVDTDQANASDRLVWYINGVRQTVLDQTAYPALGASVNFNDASAHHIGGAGTYPLYDYLADFIFLDGIAADGGLGGDFLTATGASKVYSGPYGSNGFHLKFNNAANLGEDSSGNGNHWTVNGTVSQVTDTPTNNVAVLNSTSTDGIVSNGGRAFSARTGRNHTAFSTFSVSAGKWYVESKTTAGVGSHQGWIADNEAQEKFKSNWQHDSATNSIRWHESADRLVVRQAIDTLYNGEINNGNIPGPNYIVGLALDLDSSTVQVVNIHGVQPARPIPPGLTWTWVCSSNGDSARVYFNPDEWTHTPPAGFKALTSANLTPPDYDPRDWFNVLGWNGTGSALSITGNGGQPDLTWIKNRSRNASHILVDAVRGPSQELFPNSTTTETTGTNRFNSFDVDGFSFGSSSGVIGLNNSSDNFISWNWRANGAGVTNTDGTITSTVSVAEPGHFSIVGFQANGVAGATIGHGLNGAPEAIITKARSGVTDNWRFGHKHLTDWSYSIIPNSTAGQSNGPNIFNSTSPTSSVFTIGSDGSVNALGAEIIAYCFRSVPGVCAIASYTGNGSTDGPVIDCGFRPRWVMIKRVDSSSPWTILDSERQTHNVFGNYLQANSSASEANAVLLDFLSNGFKMRTSSSDQNASGGTYIYLAMADLPFANTLESIPLAL